SEAERERRAVAQPGADSPARGLTQIPRALAARLEAGAICQKCLFVPAQFGGVHCGQTRHVAQARAAVQEPFVAPLPPLSPGVGQASLLAEPVAFGVYPLAKGLPATDQRFM